MNTDRLQPSNEVVTDFVLEWAFEGTNYGSDPDYRAIIRKALQDTTKGYGIGGTTRQVLESIGLARFDPKLRHVSLTSLGAHYVLRTTDKISAT